MQGKLFTQDFLQEGIQQTSAWAKITEAEMAAFRSKANKALTAFPATLRPNEAVTISEVIEPLMRLLGWRDVLPQQTSSGKGRMDVPDFLLFADAASKAQALMEEKEDRRYRYAHALLEAKRWQRPLDRGDAQDLLDPVAPSNQILRYLSRAEVASEAAIKWGLLTNGRHWRLYWQDARARSEEFLEFDLATLLAVAGAEPDLFSPESTKPDHFLRAFILLFSRTAFLPQADDAGKRSFHLIALQESRRWEERVSRDLGALVFDVLFPRLSAALTLHDPSAPKSHTEEYLDALRCESLVLLYRFLFVLFAEDRNLLPVHDRRYDDYSLRKIREEIASRVDAGDVFSTTSAQFYGRLNELFRAISEGDESIGIPPYNGGLFDANQHPLLTRTRLPDAEVVALLDGLSRTSSGEGRRWINYRDLSVQHLGSIYERLLEYILVPAPKGGVHTQLSVFARKDTGSYYTHDDLVKLIIVESVGPLVDERVAAFLREAKALGKSREPKNERLHSLADYDPAVRVLDLKICDPAIGSGHFLVSLVDYLADRVLELMADATAEVKWAEDGRPYESPLIRRIRDIRTRILDSSRQHGWSVTEDQLDDRHIVRRMLLKRVIHGVDKNPMAVELAKVALWLHTFTVGAPLSFLDHHIRVGDALYGEHVEIVVEELRALGSLFDLGTFTRIGVATDSMSRLSELTDVDIAEVQESRSLFDDIERELQPLWKLLDVWQALRWKFPMKGKRSSIQQGGRPVAELLSGKFGELMKAISAGTVVAQKSEDYADAEAVHTLLNEARALAGHEHFLHWELAFPTVWRNLADGRPVGGFDAVIGNPPWDRMKLQEVEWFAARRPQIAKATRASERKKLITALEKSGDPLYRAYLTAGERTDTAIRVMRECGEYPLFSGGDVNLYSLFVERAGNLIADNGLVGLLTPSGIASDLGASEFFKSVATTGRLSVLFDFENKKGFFLDVDSRFKFCALVFGGPGRTFATCRCAFFLHAVSELADPERQFSLTAKDFTTVNPNTGTAPIFRSRRDAALTTAIYGRLPVLVDRRRSPPKEVWPVKYLRMFDMTNDSHLFKTHAELESAGFYPVNGNRLRKANEEYMPLYEGKMVQMYDHRAASIVVNPNNLHRPAQPESATLAQHVDPNWLPTPQFWVDTKNVLRNDEFNWVVCFKHVTAPTNVRTMIASVAPAYGFGNSLPLFVADKHDSYKNTAPFFLANLNSMVLDYVLRQKVQGQNLNLFIIEQLPMLPPENYLAKVGNRLIGEFIKNEVLRLTYTSIDLRAFAHDMGYSGEPFKWEEEDRRHRMARLDALFFHLYSVERKDAEYILDQFPIVREQDEKAFGRYRTRELILAYMNAVAAGDLKTVVNL